jgi:hypothetical protein
VTATVLSIGVVSEDHGRWLWHCALPLALRCIGLHLFVAHYAVGEGWLVLRVVEHREAGLSEIIGTLAAAAPEFGSSTGPSAMFVGTNSGSHSVAGSRSVS